MTQWRAELQELFADVALKGELGRIDAVDEILAAIRQWIASVFRATDLGSEPALDDLLDWVVDRVSSRAKAGEGNDPLFDIDGFELAVALLLDLDFLEKARQAGELDRSLHCLARVFARIAIETEESVWAPDRKLVENKRRDSRLGRLVARANRKKRKAVDAARWNDRWTELRAAKPHLSKTSAARIIAMDKRETLSSQTIRKALLD